MFSHDWQQRDVLLQSLVFKGALMCVFVPRGVHWAGSGRHKQRHQCEKVGKQTVTGDPVTLSFILSVSLCKQRTLEGQEFNKRKYSFPPFVCHFSDERRVSISIYKLYIVLRE
jgi:hypothetical protein